jgi:hypothetical protein
MKMTAGFLMLCCACFSATAAQADTFCSGATSHRNRLRRGLARLAVLALVLAGSVFSSQTAHGVVTVYTDQTAFLNAIDPGYYLETFDGTDSGDAITQPINYSMGGFAYSVGLQPPVNSGFNALYPYTDPGGDPNDVFMGGEHSLDTIVFSLTSGNITAVGGFFFTADREGNILNVDVQVGTNQTATQTLATGGSTTTFLGFTSDTPFTELTIGLGQGGLYWASANDFIVGQATIPEPSALLLGGLACGLCGLMRVRVHAAIGRDDGRRLRVGRDAGDFIRRVQTEKMN